MGGFGVTEHRIATYFLKLFEIVEFSANRLPTLKQQKQEGVVGWLDRNSAGFECCLRKQFLKCLSEAPSKFVGYTHFSDERPARCFSTSLYKMRLQGVLL